MNQSELNFTPAPKPGELFKWGSQQYKVYEGLLAGGLTSAEIQRMGILSHTRRISDIREKLKPYLIDVEAVRVSGRTYLYKMVGAVSFKKGRTGPR
jgi:hypothetical protein